LVFRAKNLCSVGPRSHVEYDDVGLIDRGT